MKATVASFAALVATASAFMAPTPLRTTAPKDSGMSMAAGRSASIPFMPQPEKLDGSMPGDVGFDPLGLSNIGLDFTKFIVPEAAVMRDTDTSGVDNLYWMRESELKHGRIAQLAVVGWILVDQGWRFPGAQYSSIASSVVAHDPMVASGNMTLLLGMVFILELIGGAAIFGAVTGSGRAPGDFGLDPFQLTEKSDKKARYQESEIVHCRLAMFAISGICTQAVLNGGSFPYTVPY